MTDPLNRPVDQYQDRVTGMIPLDSAGSHPVEPSEEDLRAYQQEPLFNKRVMIVWAGFALAVWFVTSVVVPAAFQSAKIAIREAVQETEAAGPDGTTKVIILPNGKRITIRTDAPPHPGAAVPAPTPVIPPAPAAPAAPVLAPAPAARK